MKMKDRFKIVLNMERAFMNGLRESERSMGIKVDGFERLKVPGQVKLDGQ